MWKAVSETRQHAYIRSRVHDFEAGNNYRKHRRLGLAVTILSAIVGGSVFAALAQNNPNFWVQFGTGVLSVFAGILAAVQTFCDFSGLAEKHKKAGTDFFSIMRRADVFLSFYGKENLSDDEKSKANAEQAAILDQFTKVSEDAPIRSEEAYAAIDRRLKRRQAQAAHATI